MSTYRSVAQAASRTATAACPLLLTCSPKVSWKVAVAVLMKLSASAEPLHSYTQVSPGSSTESPSSPDWNTGAAAHLSSTIETSVRSALPVFSTEIV